MSSTALRLSKISSTSSRRFEPRAFCLVTVTDCITSTQLSMTSIRYGEKEGYKNYKPETRIVGPNLVGWNEEPRIPALGFARLNPAYFTIYSHKLR